MTVNYRLPLHYAPEWWVFFTFNNNVWNEFGHRYRECHRLHLETKETENVKFGKVSKGVVVEKRVEKSQRIGEAEPDHVRGPG